MPKPVGLKLLVPQTALALEGFLLAFYRIAFVPQTALALEGFLLSFYRITFVDQDFPSPPTCLDLPRLA